MNHIREPKNIPQSLNYTGFDLKTKRHMKVERRGCHKGQSHLPLGQEDQEIRFSNLSEKEKKGV